MITVRSARKDPGATQLNSLIPEYDRALYDLITEIEHGFAGLDPVLGQIAFRRTIHAGPIRNVPGPEPLDHSLSRAEAKMQIHVDEIRACDVEAFVRAVMDLSTQFLKQKTEHFFKVISDVTEAVGNVFNLEGRPLTPEDLIAIVEQI